MKKSLSMVITDNSFCENVISKTGECKEVFWIVKKLQFKLKCKVPVEYSGDLDSLSMKVKLVYDDSYDDISMPKGGESVIYSAKVDEGYLFLSSAIQVLSSQHQHSLFRIQVSFGDDNISYYSKSLKVVSKQRQIIAQKNKSNQKSKKKSSKRKRYQKKKKSSPKKMRNYYDDEDEESEIVMEGLNSLDNLKEGQIRNQKMLTQILEKLDKPRRLTFEVNGDLCCQFIDFCSNFHEADEKIRSRAVTKIKKAVKPERLANIILALGMDNSDIFTDDFIENKDTTRLSLTNSLDAVFLEDRIDNEFCNFGI